MSKIRAFYLMSKSGDKVVELWLVMFALAFLFQAAVSFSTFDDQYSLARFWDYFMSGDKSFNVDINLRTKVRADIAEI